MSDVALQRTVRRCTALLIVPLSLLVVQFREYMWQQAYRQRLPFEVTFLLPVALCIGAVAYLVLSALQLDRPEE